MEICEDILKLDLIDGLHAFSFIMLSKIITERKRLKMGQQLEQIIR